MIGSLASFLLAAQVLSWTVCSLSMAHRQVQYRHSPVPGSVIELVILFLKDTNYQHTEKFWSYPRDPKDYTFEKKLKTKKQILTWIDWNFWSFRQHLPVDVGQLLCWQESGTLTVTICTPALPIGPGNACQPNHEQQNKLEAISSHGCFIGISIISTNKSPQSICFLTQKSKGPHFLGSLITQKPAP